MQFAKSILFIASIVGAAHAAALAEDIAESDVMKRKSDASNEIVAMNLPLEKRACTGSCKCAKGTKRGQYCGMCSQVLYSGSGFDYQNDIFECNPEGGCCSYGKSSTCAGSDAQDKTHCPK
ncbi:hypothetical protein PG993_014592 [Apiospora rasikravindrae]|uniref:Uncharacterized protein n=1 Tax=Apiospora rasikravindrae TaxID=990691 RepID=A0ABR1RNA0_9PEZI